MNYSNKSFWNHYYDKTKFQNINGLKTQSIHEVLKGHKDNSESSTITDKSS